MSKDNGSRWPSRRSATSDVVILLALSIGATAFCSSCFDFGIDVCPADRCIDAGFDAGNDSGPVDSGPPMDSGPTDAGDVGDSGPPCEEGVAAPSTTGPQLSFVPTLMVDNADVTISVGDVLTVTNNDSMSHTMTAGGPGAPLPLARGGFDSGNIAAGTQWAYRFCSVRSVEWFCTTHPAQMNGFRLTVE